MTTKRYTTEFKKEALKQITERGYAVDDVAKRLEILVNHKISIVFWTVRFL